MVTRRVQVRDTVTLRVRPDLRPYRPPAPARPSRNGELVVRRPHPLAWAHALGMVGGQVSHLTVVDSPSAIGGTAVLVHRTPQRARLGG